MRQARGLGILYVRSVSIHAPTRGATYHLPWLYSNNSVVSIHAPTRGATRLASAQASGNQVSIHAPTRGATVYGFSNSPTLHVSIHAPTRGATATYDKIINLLTFQSTHLREVRPNIIYIFALLLWFQSTHLREVRRSMLRFITRTKPSFNPRTYERCD